jgi:hypothetical protein
MVFMLENSWHLVMWLNVKRVKKKGKAIPLTGRGGP